AQRNRVDLHGARLRNTALRARTRSFVRAVSAELCRDGGVPQGDSGSREHGVVPAEVRRYAMGDYAAALAAGATLPADRKAQVAKQLAAYTGLSEDYLVKADLRVPLRQFMAELQRSRGLVTGRLDSRFSGPLLDLLSENAPGDPQSSAVTGAFTAAVNAYRRGELKFDTRDPYVMGGGNAGQWNWTREGQRGWATTTYVGGDLTEALVANPNLRIEIENGLYD